MLAAEPVGVGTAEAGIARVWLREGRPDKSLEQAAAARGTLSGTNAVADLVEVFALHGWARLHRGDQAKAFAHANYGLQLLREAEVHEAHKSKISRSTRSTSLKNRGPRGP